MSNQEANEIEQYLSDALTEKPYGFTIGDKHLFLYPVTLGKIYRLKPIIDSLEINSENIQRDVSLEALRLAKEKKDECLTIISYHTCQYKHEIDDVMFIENRKALFNEELSDEDVASLMLIVLTTDRTNLFIKHFGIDKEHEDMRKVMEVKNRGDKNNFNFGGLTMYGSFIYPLLELGMSWNEIMWERSYTNLRLLLADKVNSIYVSDDERKHIRISKDRNRVNGDNKQAILQAIQSETWD